MSDDPAFSGDPVDESAKEGAPVDGRVLRGTRNRESIVNAFVELIREGNLRPTAQQLAERASVGTRTVFRHFEDMEGLYREISNKVEAEITPILARRPARDAPLSDRIGELVAKRSMLFDKIRAFKQSDTIHRWNSEFLRADHARMVAILRRDLVETLPEIESLPAAQAEILEAITSFETLERLRGDQKLGRERGSAAMEAGVRALLEAPREPR